MDHEVAVQLASRSYTVHIGQQLLRTLGDRCSAAGLGKKCAVVSDANVGPLYAEMLLSSLREAGFQPAYTEVPAGENSKSLDQAGAICDAMIAAGLDRHSFLVALGGGVVGDLAGFVAAIYYRGIPCVQVPTTVLAQVDSSVGGKTGVNTKGGKNLLGAFHQPTFVLADTETLRTLPAREFNEGFAEIIKHGIIRDRAMLDQLSEPDLAPLIARNVAIKAAIVAADEFETKGERALLNFGHTIGHAIENAAGYGRYLHGEAISLGIAAACRLSVEEAGLSPEECAFVIEKLTSYKLPVSLPADISTDSIMSALLKDKKFAGGEVRFVLTRELGTAFVSNHVSLFAIRRAVEGLR